MKVLTNKISVRDIIEVCGGKLCGSYENKDVAGFCTDSREAFENGVFVAIKGENSDGADYIGQALKSGCSYALSQRLPSENQDKVIVVEDTVKALGKLASWHRQQMKSLTIAAVTGSVGKTTTKEMIYSVLSEKFTTHKTDGNFNSDIGLPMSLLTLENKYKAAVYEMGMSARGEIENLSKIVKPDVALITNIGSMHIEFLGSREAIRDAKCEITAGLREGGALILNGDEPLLAGIEKAIYVSIDNQNSDIRAVNIHEGDNGSSFDLIVRGETLHSLVIPALGRHNVLNAAMAYAAGIVFGMNEYEIRRGLMNFRMEKMRQMIFNHKDITIIEDCYNAGPESMKASLGVLQNYCLRHSLRPVAVLGEMRELGSFSDELHRKVGETVGKFAGELFTIGNSTIASGAENAGMSSDKIFELKDMPYEKAAVVIASMLKPGDCLLFKASRAMKLENLIEELKKVY